MLFDADVGHEFDGRVHLVFDNDQSALPFVENAAGNRFIFVCCCDGGAVHEFCVRKDRVTARRADPEQAERVRTEALRQNSTLFPLRRTE